ncbi:hypothetical protein R1flu_024159 [Riccia fluitans]|uniref:RRM domain-containing protein n=1 Tax=Riccia fluitans TaxID=41844 RepID=A0ABD1XU37_9MARC
MEAKEGKKGSESESGVGGNGRGEHTNVDGAEDEHLPSEADNVDVPSYWHANPCVHITGLGGVIREGDLMPLLNPHGSIVSFVFENERKETAIVRYERSDSTDEEVVARVRSALRNTRIKDKMLSVEPFRPDSLLFIGNLTPEIDDVVLRQMFVPHGTVERAFVVRNAKGRSKGYGFVEYSLKSQANAAKVAMGNINMDGRVLRVEWSDCRRVVDMFSTVLFVDRINKDCPNIQQTLKNLFSQYGKVRDCQMAIGMNQQFRGFAFVDFYHSISADEAHEALDGREVEGSNIRVSFANPSKTAQAVVASEQQYVQYGQQYLQQQQSDVQYNQTFAQVVQPCSQPSQQQIPAQSTQQDYGYYNSQHQPTSQEAQGVTAASETVSATAVALQPQDRSQHHQRTHEAVAQTGTTATQSATAAASPQQNLEAHWAAYYAAQSALEQAGTPSAYDQQLSAYVLQPQGYGATGSAGHYQLPAAVEVGHKRTADQIGYSTQAQVANDLHKVIIDLPESVPEPAFSAEKEIANARNHAEEEEEYVMLDLSQVFHGAALPPNCSYTLSGLDTMNPVLTLGDDLKLIGEYEETVGTILVFTESEEEVPGEERKRGINESRTRKRISNFCKTERKLKFRIMDEEERKETEVHNIRVGRSVGKGTVGKSPDAALPLNSAGMEEWAV